MLAKKKLRAPQNQGRPTHLQWKSTTTMSRAQCQQIYAELNPNLINAENICTRNTIGVGNCMGDYGGALTTSDGTAIGLSSWNNGCAQGAPDVYLKLWDAMPFIRSTTRISVPSQ